MTAVFVFRRKSCASPFVLETDGICFSLHEFLFASTISPVNFEYTIVLSGRTVFFDVRCTHNTNIRLSKKHIDVSVFTKKLKCQLWIGICMFGRNVHSACIRSLGIFLKSALFVRIAVIPVLLFVKKCVRAYENEHER